RPEAAGAVGEEQRQDTTPDTADEDGARDHEVHMTVAVEVCDGKRPRVAREARHVVSTRGIETTAPVTEQHPDASTALVDALVCLGDVGSAVAVEVADGKRGRIRAGRVVDVRGGR